MIKQLQRKFIRIAMVTLTIAMVLVVGFVNLANWFSVQSELFGTLDQLALSQAEATERFDASREEEERETYPADRPVTFRMKPEERPGGDKLSAFLAFVPMDVKELSMTRFESYLVNDSNYYLRYVYMTAEGNAWQVRATAEVEPNTKEFIEEFGREDLNGLERCCIQLVAYKRDKHFLLKPPVNAQLRIDPVKFYKLHTFVENDFFEQPALIYPIIENDVQKVLKY